MTPAAGQLIAVVIIALGVAPVVAIFLNQRGGGGRASDDPIVEGCRDPSGSAPAVHALGGSP